VAADLLEKQLRCLCIFLPNLSRDEGWVDYNEVKRVLQVGWYVLWLVEVVKHITWVLVKRPIKLQSTMISNAKTMPNTYIKVFGGSLDGFAFETVIDAGRRHEGALECCSILLRTELLDLAGHEFNGGL
jgi:hypothetical protein